LRSWKSHVIRIVFCPRNFSARWRCLTGRIASSAHRVRLVDPTTFSVAIRQAGPVSLLDVSGRLTFFEVGALRDSISRLLKRGRKNIVLNLSGSAIPGQLRNWRACKNLRHGGERKRAAQSGRFVGESGRHPQDYPALPGFPGISERRSGSAEFFGIHPLRSVQICLVWENGPKRREAVRALP
jgi:hypothetical protein